MAIRPKIVLVSGSPGAGKTTLAKPLAEKLGFSLISKDAIKETLADHLKIDFCDLDENRRIGGAAMEVMWKLAASCPRIVLEANFRPRSDYERSKIEALDGKIIEVYCKCSVEEASRRFSERARSKDHHPVHTFREMPPEMIAHFGQPIGVGRLIEVDTEKTVSVYEISKTIGEIFREQFTD
ncbi:MAG: AAA family ATPase [Acidobacteria bacterium]|nr:AAA family ATPase [Acidobacteriota bacterium]